MRASAISVDAEERPEAILAAAKKASADQAWRVSAHVVGDREDRQISGIVFGKDFDLSVETVKGVTRRIVVGDQAWLSDDDGKTWKKGDAADRRFYYLVHTPIHFAADESIPPFESVEKETVGGKPALHVRFKSPQKINYEGDRPNWWILLDNEKPTVICRYHGPAVLDRDYVRDEVTYEPVTDKQPVLPPPGNPNARTATASGAEKLLQTALKNLSTGVWEVDGTARVTKTIHLHGLLSGKNFDLAWESQPGPGMRQIVIGNKCWINSPEKGWHAGDVNDLLIYSLAHTPILPGRLQPAFEKVDSSSVDGGSLFHIRLKVDPNDKTDPKDLPQYWLMLDPEGKALYVRKAQINIFEPSRPGEAVACAFDYTPAKGKVITPPPKK